MASKTVEFGVVTYGAKSQVDEVVALRKPSTSVLSDILEIQPTNDHGNVIEGMSTAFDILMETNEGKKYNRLLLVITSGNIHAKAKDYANISQRITQNNVILYAIVIDDPKVKSENSNQGITDFLNFVHSCNGYSTVTNQYLAAMKFLSSGPGLGTRPVNSKMTLELAPNFRIPCVCFVKIMKGNLPSLKKQSNVSYDPEIPDSGKIQMQTVYRNPNDPDEELEFEARVKGYKYGPQYIPLGAEMEGLFKIESDPVIRLLGFVSAQKVFRYHFIESPIIVNGEPNTEGSVNTIATLATALHRTAQVAIVRYVKRANSDPWLAALMAPKVLNGTLLLHRLPCLEDIRSYMFPPLFEKSSNDQTSAISKAIDSITLNITNLNEVLIYNPSLLSVIQALQTKLEDDEKEIEGNDFNAIFTSDMYTNPDVSAVWEKALSRFELVFIDKKANKKRKMYWSDIKIDGIVDGQQGNNDVKKAGLAGQPSQAIDVDGEDTIPGDEDETNTLPGPINIGSVTPAEDFDNLRNIYQALRAKPTAGEATEVCKKVISDSIGTLGRVIELLVTAGGTGAHYRKAIVCLKSLRAGCIECEEYARFNDFLRNNIKNAFNRTRHQRFWDEVKQEKITLISSDDARSCSLSSVESQQFLDDVVEISPASTAANTQTQEDDDLFDFMS